MTETLLHRLLLTAGLSAGLMFGMDHQAAGLALAIAAGGGSWLVRSKNLIRRRF